MTRRLWMRLKGMLDDRSLVEGAMLEALIRGTEYTRFSYGLHRSFALQRSPRFGRGFPQNRSAWCHFHVEGRRCH